jgi:hypothetical protein
MEIDLSKINPFYKELIEKNQRFMEENNIKSWDEYHQFVLKARLESRGSK